jgi:hypothetical protein
MFDEMNDRLEIEGDAREDVEGFSNLRTPEEKAEFEAWLDGAVADAENDAEYSEYLRMQALEQ